MTRFVVKGIFFRGEKILMKDFSMVRATLSQNFSFYSSRFFLLPQRVAIAMAGARCELSKILEIIHPNSAYPQTRQILTPKNSSWSSVQTSSAFSQFVSSCELKEAPPRRALFFWGRFMPTAFQGDCSYIKICKKFGSCWSFKCHTNRLKKLFCSFSKVFFSFS